MIRLCAKTILWKTVCKHCAPTLWKVFQCKTVCQQIVCWKTVRQKPHQPQKQSSHWFKVAGDWFKLSGAFPVLFQCFMGKPQDTLGLFHLVSTFCWSVPPGVHLLLVQMPPYLRRWQSTFQSVPGIGVQFPQSRCALQKQWFEAILWVLTVATKE